ncbi:MAG: SPOR domain-containing protein [Clostridiales bacterium]|nr:SPOR domain-containing protein [Clostridiales bacterium]
MQEQEPYVITKRKHVIYRVYWGRIAAFLIAASLAVLAVVLWFSRGKNTITVPSRTYWCVSVGTYDSRETADASANRAAALGGAGYVHEADGKFYVFVSCYPTEEDAVTVGNRLDGEADVSVYALVCNKSSFEAPKKNKEEAEDLLTFAPFLFDSLYDLAIRTDKGEVSRGAALYAMRNMAASVREKRRTCENTEGDIKTYASELCDVLSRALEPFDLLENTENLPQQMKYALCFSAVEICNITQDFENNAKNRA